MKVLVLTCISFFIAANHLMADLSPYQKMVKNRYAFFKGRILTTPASSTETIAVLDFSDKSIWPLTYKDSNISDFHVKNGVISFKLNAKSATLGWGNYKTTYKKNIKSISWKQGAYVVMKIRQEHPANQQWAMDFRYNADSRETGMIYSYCGRWLNKFKNTVSGTGWKDVESSFIQQLGEADGFGLTVSGEKGSIVEIASIKIIKKDYQVWARKSFILPNEPVYSALFNISTNEDVWVNGKQVYKRITDMYGEWYKHTSIDIKPYLRPGENVISLYDPMDNPRCPICWIQGTITTNFGKIFSLVSDKSWKTSGSFSKGWAEIDFDDSTWKETGSFDPMGYLQAQSMRPVFSYEPCLLPIYDGLISLSNPDGEKLFYNDKNPVAFNIGFPPDMARPEISYSIYNESTGERIKSGKAVFIRKTEQAMNFKIDAGKLVRGVYSICLNADKSFRAEPFIVIGKIPMPEVDNTAWDAGCKLTLVDQIDCTNPNDTHPFQDAGIVKPEYASKIVEKNGLKYRETTLKNDYYSNGSWFSYRIKFKNINKPHWVVVEYPDDAARCMEWELRPFFTTKLARESLTCSWTSSGVVTGGKYLNTGKILQARLLLWPQQHDTIISFIKTFTSKGTLAVSGVKVYEIDKLPALKTTDRGRLFGLVTERAVALEQTYGPSNAWIQLFRAQGPRFSTFPEKFPEKYEYNSFLRWFETAENYAKYCRFTGQNAYFQGTFQYARGNQGLPYCTGAEGSSLVLDLRDVVINVLDANGIKTFATFEYCKNYNYHSVGTTAPHQAFKGKDNMFQTDTVGSRSRAGNPSVTGRAENPVSSPLARKAYMEEIKVTAERLSIYPGFKGISVIIAPSWEGPAYPNERSSYDDQTIALFERESGIKVPVKDSGMRRFQKRYDWLMKNARVKWMEWRSQKIAEIHEEASRLIKSVKPELDYLVMLEVWNRGKEGLIGAYDKKTKTAKDVLDGHGYNPEAYKNIKDFSLGRVLWSFYNPDSSSFRGYDDTHWNYPRDPNVIELFNIGGGKGRAALVRTGFSEGLVTSMYNAIKGKAWPLAHRLGYLYPSGENMMSRFTEMLIDSDIDTFLYGFCDCHTCTGEEGRFRAFTGEFISLPDSRFTALQGKGFDKNISIKESENNNQYFLYIANPGWWECKVKLKISGKGPIKFTRTGLPVTTNQDNIVEIKLKPYGIIGLTGEKNDLKPIQAEVEIPNTAINFLKGELGKIQEASGVKIESAELAMKNGHFTTAWEIMSSWKNYQSLLKQKFNK